MNTWMPGIHNAPHDPQWLLEHTQASEQIIGLLLEYGANPDAQISTDIKKSALTILSGQKSKKAVETLLGYHPKNMGESIFYATEENRAVIAPYCTIEELKYYIDNSNPCTIINSIYLAKSLEEKIPASDKKKMHKI